MYFIITGNQQKGPFTLVELSSMQIEMDTPVWKEGMKDWIKASDIKELQSLFQNRPPKYNQSQMDTSENGLQRKSFKITSFHWIGIIVLLVIVVVTQALSNDNHPVTKN